MVGEWPTPGLTARCIAHILWFTHMVYTMEGPHDVATVITTGDWIPDHELARTAGLTMDYATRGPLVDGNLHTTAPGVFAIGNLLHPVDTADGAALDGRHVAPRVRDWLRDRTPGARGIRIHAHAPFRWVSPQLINPDGGIAPRGDLLLWVDECHRAPTLRAVQDGRTIGVKRTPWPAAPGRIYRAPWSLVSEADPAGGSVTIAGSASGVTTLPTDSRRTSRRSPCPSPCCWN